MGNLRANTQITMKPRKETGHSKAQGGEHHYTPVEEASLFPRRDSSQGDPQAYRNNLNKDRQRNCWYGSLCQQAGDRLVAEDRIPEVSL